MNYFFVFFYSLLAVFMPAAVSAKNTTDGDMVEAIRFAGKQQGYERIELKLSNHITPKMFMLNGDKPRIVFDFIKTGYPGKAKRMVYAGGEYIEKVRVGLHNAPVTKTRIVIDLVKGVTYDVQQSFQISSNVLEVKVAPRSEIAMKSEVLQTSETADFSEQKTDPEVQSQIVQKVETKEQQVKDVEPAEKEISQEDSVAEPAGLSSSGANINIFATDEDAEVSPDAETGEDDTKDSPIILDVSFESSTNDKEMVLFRLNGFFPPVVFATEEDDLRVVCDFLDGVLGYGIEKEMLTNGKYINKVRIANHDNPQKVRVVLELTPKFNYDLKQVFFEEDNLFVVIISNLGKKD